MNFWQCERCGWKSPVEGIQVKEREEGDLQVKFFACSKCGKEYVIQVTDTELRRRVNVLQRKYNALVLRAKTRKFSQKEIDRARGKLEIYRKKLLGDLDRMKKAYMEVDHGQETREAD
jgi:predicted RNA-binding Zn-ribbon protein involved in translation (DUF1610 family)